MVLRGTYQGPVSQRYIWSQYYIPNNVTLKKQNRLHFMPGGSLRLGPGKNCAARAALLVSSFNQSNHWFSALSFPSPFLKLSIRELKKRRQQRERQETMIWLVEWGKIIVNAKESKKTNTEDKILTRYLLWNFREIPSHYAGKMFSVCIVELNWT